MRITEQGEVISAKYADPGLAGRSLEQQLSGAPARARRAGRGGAGDAFRAEIDRAADRSRGIYRELVDDEEFVRFFRQVSPIDELAELTIGSRPASRAHGGRLEDLRAIPWVFAWTQNRILLPSWFGAGTALEEGDLELPARDVARAGRSSGWRARRSRWRCSRSTSSVGRRYLALVDDDLAERFWPRSRPSTPASSPACWRSATASALLDGAPALRDRLSHRNRWVDPLSHLQVALLARARAGDATVGEALMATITGIAAGLRNTGYPGGAVCPYLQTWTAERQDAGQPRCEAYLTAGRVPPMSPVVTPRPPVAAQHAFSTPVVRELPPVYRPGMFDSTW